MGITAGWKRIAQVECDDLISREQSRDAFPKAVFGQPGGINTGRRLERSRWRGGRYAWRKGEALGFGEE